LKVTLSHTDPSGSPCTLGKHASKYSTGIPVISMRLIQGLWYYKAVVSLTLLVPLSSCTWIQVRTSCKVSITILGACLLLYQYFMQGISTAKQVYSR
jgi:hypothetical protein